MGKVTRADGDGSERPVQMDEMREVESGEKQVLRLTPYERTRARVYATGNRWQIENFEATH